jgi:hypothetical protein
MQTLQSGIDIYLSEFNLEKQFSEYYVSLTTADYQNIRVLITMYVPPPILNTESWFRFGVSGDFLTRSNTHILHSVLPLKIKHTMISRTLFLILKGIDVYKYRYCCQPTPRSREFDKIRVAQLAKKLPAFNGSQPQEPAAEPIWARWTHSIHSHPIFDVKDPYFIWPIQYELYWKLACPTNRNRLNGLPTCALELGGGGGEKWRTI